MVSRLPPLRPLCVPLVGGRQEITKTAAERAARSLAAQNACPAASTASRVFHEDLVRARATRSGTSGALPCGGAREPDNYAKSNLIHRGRVWLWGSAIGGRRLSLHCSHLGGQSCLGGFRPEVFSSFFFLSFFFSFFLFRFPFSLLFRCFTSSLIDLLSLPCPGCCCVLRWSLRVSGAARRVCVVPRHFRSLADDNLARPRCSSSTTTHSCP